jgi:hypothetical protein
MHILSRTQVKAKIMVAFRGHMTDLCRDVRHLLSGTRRGAGNLMEAGMTRNVLLGGVAAVAVGVLLSASAAKADLITVSTQEAGYNSNQIEVQDTGSGYVNWTPVPYGTFSNTQGNAEDTSDLGGLPGLLGSNTLEVSAAAAGTIYIYVTAQDPASLSTGNHVFTSGFTANLLPAGWSVTETTYLNTSNGLYNASSCSPAPCLTTSTGLAAGTTMLDSATFTTIGTAGPDNNTQMVSGAFSVTEVYEIVATGAGTTIDTESLTASVPEPASLSLFGGALLAAGAWQRRKNRKNAKA